MGRFMFISGWLKKKHEDILNKIPPIDNDELLENLFIIQIAALIGGFYLLWRVLF